MISGKSKIDEILGAQMIGNKHQGLWLAKCQSTSTLAPTASQATPETSFVIYWKGKNFLK